MIDFGRFQVSHLSQNLRQTLKVLFSEDIRDNDNAQVVDAGLPNESCQHGVRISSTL